MKYVSLLSNVRGGISNDGYMQCASHLYSLVNVCTIQLFPKEKKKKKLEIFFSISYKFVKSTLIWTSVTSIELTNS